MNNKKYLRKTKKIIVIFFLYSLLSGCKYNNINPSSLIVSDQISLIFIAFFLMLLVVIPAIFMSLYFSWKYKEKNKNKNYNPNFLYSKKIELIVWIVPILIILILSIITWYSTHKLDPYKTNYFNKVKPINIEVVSFDWKWLFIYPEKNIAMINQVVFPVNTPIIFHITSNTVMNSFFIPMLSSQIYAMAGMKTKLNLIANKYGNLTGISSNFSGKGFTGMKFKVIVTKNQFDFEKWIKKAKISEKKINNLQEYQNISQPTINNPVELFSNIDLDIFNKIIQSKINNKRIDLPES